jgi:diguanylate cyclase (GGDEF)-like protein
MVRPNGQDDAQRELARLRSAIEASGDVVYDWDLATDRIDWIGRVAAIFGMSDSAVPQSGDRYNGRINPEDLPTRMHALSEHFAGCGFYDCEYRLRADNGEFHWVHDRGSVEISANGTPVRLSGSLRRITERKLNESRLEFLANYDELTGHFNKLRLREALEHALAQSQRYDQPGAFLAVGIDQLDRINTAYGCEVGDAVLVETAQRLDHCLRAVDVIGRLGSDRFGVVLSRCSEPEALRTAERIVQAIHQSSMESDGHRVSVTISIGLVVFPEQSRTSFDVIAKSEGALLKAKSAGRDCAEVYRMSEAQRQCYRESMEVGEEVTQALKDDRLVFAYQPIIDAHSHEVRYYECLLRMYAPDGNLVSAGHFIPVIERLGLVRTIDRRVLDMTLNDLEHDDDLVLALNISGITAADRSWLRALIARLTERPDLARRMVVEITETAALHDLDDSARFVSAVRDLGCRVAVDDFGAGYTTFRHLKALTVDIVKIDGSFVRDLAHSTENQLFIRNLLALARAFNLESVAECVETAEDAAILTSEGVSALQGYYFGKPELIPRWRIGEKVEPDQGAEIPEKVLDRRATR